MLPGFGLPFIYRFIYSRYLIPYIYKPFLINPFAKEIQYKQPEFFELEYGGPAFGEKEYLMQSINPEQQILTREERVAEHILFRKPHILWFVMPYGIPIEVANQMVEVMVDAVIKYIDW